MSAIATPLSETTVAWKLPYRGKIGIACLIIAESAIFTIFVVAYLFYLGKSVTGPTPHDVLEVPVFYTICLLSSSVTIHLAARRLERDAPWSFVALWLITIVLGGLFMYGTAQEWHRLIYEHGLTISTNLFGTTFYSLVGLHASHVVIGLTLLLLTLVLGLRGSMRGQARRFELLSWYWHFVDAVWVAVFTVVYVIGR